jgi:SAM-dependent methyltransferase
MGQVMAKRPVAEYVEWDVGNFSRALQFWSGYGRPVTGADALEIGARNGGLSLWLAESGARSVVCSDKGGPSPAAADLHRQADSVIAHEDIDATIAHHQEQFDLVVFKSVLGSTGSGESQRRVMSTILDALRPGGELWFAENLRASPVHRAARRLFVPWSKTWAYVDVDGLDPLLAGFQDVTLCAWGLLGAFGRTENQRSALAAVDRYGLERAVTRRSRYIVAGVARKPHRPMSPESVRKKRWVSPARVR